MAEIAKSYDGGQSKNLFYKDYDEEFIKEKGYEKWMSYREEWEKCCALEEINYPLHLEIELNYSCNLRCPMCTWSMEKTVEKRSEWFTFENYKKLLTDAVASGTKSVRLCYVNEPLLRPDLDQFIKCASDLGIVDILITTNGTLLTRDISKKIIESGLTKLNVSLDATTEETYNKVRVGGNFNITIKNILDFLEVRKSLNKKLPKLRVTFVRTKINDHEREAFVNYWKDKADSIGIQNAINPFGDGRFKDPSKKELLIINNKNQNKNEGPNEFHCPEPFKRMTVRDNGDVLGCCSMYAMDLVVGNWKKNTLKDIWNGDKMKELRSIHKSGEYYKNNTCKMCVENYSFITD
ncbi:MAG: SPASM domain-containing protein [Patescibacteria group bacterium]|nr:SPASM domain-containing protein [Patescibacteria group bacterium]